MAQTIKIKQSNSSQVPSAALAHGELAYGHTTGDNGKLSIGRPGTTAGSEVNDVIGGKIYVDKLNLIGANDTSVVATSAKHGAIKIGYSENGKNYPVELSSDKAYVNVPWTDTNETLAQTLVLGATTGGTDISVSAGDDINFLGTSTSSKAIFGGTSSDANRLEIYHDGTTSHITELGAGGLVIAGEDLTFQDASAAIAMKMTTVGSDRVFEFRDGSDVQIAQFKAGEIKINSTSQLKTDDISETTTAHGVHIDSVILKDGEVEGNIKTDLISEKTAANGVVIDSVTLKDGGVIATGSLEGTNASFSSAPDTNNSSITIGYNSGVGEIKVKNNNSTGAHLDFFTTNSSNTTAAKLRILDVGGLSISTGNVTMDGTLTGVSALAMGGAITGATSVQTDLISEKTAANGVVIDSVTLKDGGVFATGDSSINGNLYFPASKKIQMGTTTSTTNLEIYTDSANSIIEENRSGSLILRGTNLSLQAADDTNFLQAVLGGAVTLYHTTSDGSGGYNATPRIFTSTSGATVSGSLTVSGDLNITGNVNSTSVTDLDVTDKTITVGVGQSSAQAGASGLEVDRTDGTNPKFLYNGTQFEIDDGDGNLHGVIHEGNSATQTYTIDGGTF